MASTVVLDSRVRTLAVFVPALAIAVWIASEAASEEFLAPLLVIMGFVALVIFTVFVRSVRFETAVLNLLLVGYLVGNRGFADITVAKPFYPGEACMVVVLVAMSARYILTRELPDFGGMLARTILIYLALGAVRLAFDFQAYRLDAVRDSAMVYYAIYFFFGRQMVTSGDSKAVLEKCLKFSFLALVPIAVTQRFAPDLMVNNGYMTLLFQKDDLLTTFASVGVLILYTRPKIFRPAWTRTAAILFFLVFVVNGITRSSLVGLAAGVVLLVVAGKKKFLLYPIVAAVLGITVLAGFAVTWGGADTTSDVAALSDKLYSIVDISGTHEYSTDVGKYKQDTNEFRRTLWQTFVDETNAVSPAFGRGFGFDFIPGFESTFQKGEFDNLRSAHNYYVTLYGRMGAVGLLVFAAISWQIVAGGLRAARAVSRGQVPLEVLGFWCAVWAILTSAALGVVLEGPVGAIVFWLLLGVAVRTTEDALAAAREARLEEDIALPEVAPAGGLQLGYHKS